MDVIILMLVNFNANDSRLAKLTPCMSGQTDSGK